MAVFSINEASFKTDDIKPVVKELLQHVRSMVEMKRRQIPNRDGIGASSEAKPDDEPSSNAEPVIPPSQKDLLTQHTRNWPRESDVAEGQSRK